LSVELADPIQIRYTAGDDHDVKIFSKLSGGTDESPSDIYIDTMGNWYCKFVFNLFNTNNTFRGDIYVGAESTVYESSTGLYLGAGWSGHNQDADSMCGDPANRIILRNRASVRLEAPSGAPANFGRTLMGSGTLMAWNKWSIWPNDWNLRSLHLSPSAQLKPSGTLTVNAAGFTADPEVQYVFSVSATNGVSGQIAVSVNEPLTLDGNVMLTQFDENERIPVGTSWDIMTVAASATTFAPNLACSSGYTIETSGDATAGWTVSIVKALSGTLLIIK
jgi:hypothetical protein